MAKETREQRQQRLLQSKLAREARQQEIIEGLPTLGAQAGWMGGLMLPSSGLTDYFGMYPQIPTEEQMIPTERLPSFSENIANKRYMDALYQSMGVLGDAAYASAPFTGPAGLVAGTALKGTSAIGKASKAKGIASLQEKSDLAKAVKQKQKEAMERHANDYSDNLVATTVGGLDYSSREIPFVSPTLEALIKRAPKNLKGKQVMEWVNANANKGVKPKEVEYLGIDEFIANNPNATVDEVIESISDNKISIQKSIYKSDDQKFLEFDITTPDTDPLDGTPLHQYLDDDIRYNLEQRDPNEIRYFLDDAARILYGKPIPANMSDSARFENLDELSDWLKKWESSDDVPDMDELIDQVAKVQYDRNPYELVKPMSGPGGQTFAFGNDDVGYQLFVDGHRIDTQARTGDIPYSRTEAQIQLRQAMSDYGDDYYRLEGEDDFATGATQFKDYIDNNLPGGDNYREVSFNWENAPKGHSHADHIQEDNQIAHALIRDRKLADGTDSLHIDELQSDLHKYGSRHGYQTKEAIELSNKELSKFNSLIDDEYENLQPILKKYDLDLTEVDWNLSPDGGKNIAKGIAAKDYVNKAVQKYTAQEMVGASQLPKDLNDALMKLEDAASSSIDESGKLFKMVPDYPFKDDWYNMGIKSLLMDAVEDGKDAISISTSAAMKNRYSDQYHKFYETLYDKKIPSAMQKLAKKYGGKFEKGSLDLDNTYGAGFKETARNPNVMTPKTSIELAEANTIKITPEMRKKVLEEGVHTFASGGVIGNLPSRLAKI